MPSKISSFPSSASNKDLQEVACRSITKDAAEVSDTDIKDCHRVCRKV